MSEKTDIRSKVEVLLKRRDSEFERLTVAERWYIDQLESLVKASVGLVEALNRVNRVRNAAVFADSEIQINAMFHEVDAALAAFQAEVEKLK